MMGSSSYLHISLMLFTFGLLPLYENTFTNISLYKNGMG